MWAQILISVLAFAPSHVYPTSLLRQRVGKSALPVEGLPLIARVDQQIRRHGETGHVPLCCSTVIGPVTALDYHKQVQVATYSPVASRIRTKIADTNDIASLQPYVFGPAAHGFVDRLAIRPF